MATFWLLAMLAHHIAVDRAERGLKWRWWVVAAALCVPPAFLCKEEAVLLPAVLFVMEAARWKWVGGRGRRVQARALLTRATAMASAYGFHGLDHACRHLAQHQQLRLPSGRFASA